MFCLFATFTNILLVPVAQGKPSRSMLETMWAQTAVLFDDIRDTGGLAQFVDLKHLTMPIQASLQDADDA